MKVNVSITKELSHKFPLGKSGYTAEIKATIRDGRLMDFTCCDPRRQAGNLDSLKGTALIIFLMENENEVGELWNTVKGEILPKLEKSSKELKRKELKAVGD
ncbi:unnamed protein product [marine sediment metagenome]|uniref:Uncharacterized protein n=1 Tax=marine sediment metagenome TaxID=412755 RepID=X0SLQ0_9ZZZZ